MKLNQNMKKWYQKKIGSYDKQKWERTLEEQKIIDSALSFPLRSTKLKTDFIDIDLVRGSTFPKLKPKQSLIQVLYLSVLRYFFLPLFSRWWVKETSAKVFIVLLVLYFLQMINWAIYSLHAKRIGEDDENIIPLCELLVPMSLSLLLCFVHSQIVATSVVSSRSSKSRQHKMNFNGKISKIDKIKRRKKVFRPRLSSNSLDIKTMEGYDSDDEQSIPNINLELNSSLKNKNIIINESKSNPESPVIRRRNVNWNLADNANLERPADQQQIRLRRGFQNPLVARLDDDGFESLTGKSCSSGEEIRQHIQNQSESDTETLRNTTPIKKPKKDGTKNKSDTSESEFEENDDLSSPSTNQHFETTDGEYIGVTSNSESECAEDGNYSETDDDNFPTNILTPNDSSEKVSVTLWTKREPRKAEMSVLEISKSIIQRVDNLPETYDYVYIGGALSIILSITPIYCRLCDLTNNTNSTNNIFDLPRVIQDDSLTISTFVQLALGQSFWEMSLYLISTFQRLVLTFCFFFLLAVAERTFKQRFLYAKLFSHLTSTRRARKSLIPHFRLNKVRNIKAWLSVRSYLKRLGPQRSVDIIVSAAFITTLILLAFLSLEFLKDSEHIHSQINLEALVFSSCCGIFMLRFFTLGAKINKKYRSISVLITEQINLYVQIEKKPQKKEELGVSNSVLKLASDLLKELDSPFKISGLSANSYLYNTVKVVVLSALSGVLSEMLGFKLKLHKIKIK
ncbi:hypothetical protein ACKWTF_003521 [Chironomus riparius]